MGQITLLAATATLALFGWGWLKSLTGWFKHPFNHSARVQEQLQDDGVIKADGTVSTDTEFDLDLNAISKDLGTAQVQADVELNAAAEVK